ncbi:peptidase domain-containing ABC transporter [Aliifodinibius sp. S!AR15-10]|uniref:peptidase domain-containing ABC transporter n=1 Tax=Aliifodinibius sp. S!AR15-10 TaxID=2950437 RepID=UPI002864C4ED|nr:peptidase domain-containing ABC transporter [Aliifodinibius sp. S!AR15-10]MDR8393097.1 peptidase domain-containing ABC transporter [Aliifodinibius sp. S!AR15-10]
MKFDEEDLKKRAEKSFIQQRDQSDCGVTCLASVIKFLGGEAKLQRLREMSGTNQQGTTLLGLYQSANELGLEAEAYKADTENLKEQSDPCILHVIKGGQLQHYVICFGFKNNQFLICDPAVGVTSYSPEELEKVWQSNALLLIKPTDQFETIEEQKEDRWVWIKHLIKDDLNILGLALALGVFVSVLSLATAIFSQKLIDEILPAKDTLKLFVGLGLLGFLLVAKSGLSYIRQLFLIRQTRDFNNRIINTFYSSLLKLPIPFFFNRKTGDLIARMNDTRRLQQTITFLFSQIMIDVLLVVTASIFILSYSVPLGLFVLLSVPLYFLLTWFYNEPILKGQKEVMEAHSLNESNYVDTIQGMATIKTGNRQQFFSGFTKRIYGFFQDKIFDLGKVGIRFTFWADMIGVFFIVGVLGFTSMLVLQEELMVGALVAIFQMTSQLIPSATKLALTNIQLQEARVAFDRMYELTSLEPERENGDSDDQKFTEKIQFLEVQTLAFRFPGRSRLIEDVSFEVEKGEMIALLGESGSGKTTLLQILQQFYKPESGNIIINKEHSLHDFPVKKWRSKIAVVRQQTKLFNSSLLENICLGDLQKEAEEIVEFCKQEGFDRYFSLFPRNYATLLGEEGTNISGGQQQLIALARALYQQPDLLLLDEATASMDREMEQFVLEKLVQLKEEMAIILVTHRIQSSRLADRIYILENGTIAEQGSPEILASGNNLFARSLDDIRVLT